MQQASDKVEEERSKLEKATVEFKNLLKRTHTDLDVRFENKNLIKCWEALNCTKVDCPVYGGENLRCWHGIGTLCEAKNTLSLVIKSVTASHVRCICIPIKTP